MLKNRIIFFNADKHIICMVAAIWLQDEMS